MATVSKANPDDGMENGIQKKIKKKIRKIPNNKTETFSKWNEVFFTENKKNWTEENNKKRFWFFFALKIFFEELSARIGEDDVKNE